MLRLFPSLLILCLGAWPALAGEYVTCVQNQLAGLGHDPGPVDGLMGRRTVAASQAYAGTDAQPEVLPRLPALTHRTALTWCRELGTAHPAVARFWPSVETPHIRAEDDTWRHAALASAFDRARRYYAQRHGMRPASRVDLGGSDKPAVLARYTRELMALRGTRAGANLKTAQRHCDTDGDTTGAYAYRDQILLCWPGQPDYDRAWSEAHKDVFERLMVHEFMHHVQNELTNTKALRTVPRGDRRPMGPEWLVEGSATVVELDFLLRNTRKKPSLFMIQTPARVSTLRLAEMRDYGTVRESEAYDVSLSASWMLAERAGRPALFDYWRLVGMGQSWEQAFESSFGLPLSAFETRFETLRRDHDQAIAFVAGADPAE